MGDGLDGGWVQRRALVKMTHQILLLATNITLYVN